MCQTDQGNHIHQWNTLIFSLFQQEMQERNHQEWKLLYYQSDAGLLEPGGILCDQGDDFLSYLNESYLMKLAASISVQLALKSRKCF